MKPTCKLSNIVSWLWDAESAGQAKQRFLRAATDYQIDEPDQLLAQIASLKKCKLGKKQLFPLIECCLTTPFPQSALYQLAQLVEQQRFSYLDRAEPFLILSGSAPFLGRTLLHNPALNHDLVEGLLLETPFSVEDLQQRLEQVVYRASPGDSDSQMRALREVKYACLAQITKSLIDYPDQIENGLNQLSRLANELIRAAFKLVVTEEYKTTAVNSVQSLEQVVNIAIIGLGKLGGDELNYSSDVDLLFVRGRQLQSDPNSRLAMDLESMVKRFTERLARRTNLGFCYRVDLRLRPRGSSGSVVLPFTAMENYYHREAMSIERLSLLKSASVVGDTSLGQAFLAMADKFVYRKYLAYDFIDSIKQIKQKIDREGKALSRDIKLGPGGIREIEFVVQTLQVIYGGRDRSLRSSNSMRAIEKLLAAGYLKSDDAEVLSGSYLLYRKIENAVQMVEERQTHQVPEPASAAWASTAIASGERRDSSLFPRKFESDVQKCRDKVHEIFLKFFESPSEGRRRVEQLSTKSLQRLSGTVSKELAKINEHLSGSDIIAEKEVDQLLTDLVSYAEETPDPNSALRFMSDFLGSIHAKGSLARAILANRQTLRFLLGLFGTSNTLSRFFVRHPEMADRLLIYGDLLLHDRRQRFQDAAMTMVFRRETFEERLEALRLFKNGETLRIALNDLYGEYSLEQSMAMLTDLAEACIQVAIAITFSELGVTSMPLYLIVGLGKLGGREMGYGSDLDLVFLVNEESEDFTLTSGKSLSGFELMVRVAQKIMTILQLPTTLGVLYRLDTRLRPSGNQGTLVTTVQGFKQYIEEKSQLWERQAWLKARRVAGDPQLWREVERVVAHKTFAAPLSEGDVQTIQELRFRLEKELASDLSGQYNIKSGWGGLNDIEFSTQLLQLSCGAACPDVVQPSTLDALHALAKNQCVDRQSYETLVAGYQLMRLLENRMFLLTHKHDSGLQEDRDFLDRVGKAVALASNDKADGNQLLNRYKHMASEVRQTFQRVIQECRQRAISNTERS